MTRSRLHGILFSLALLLPGTALHAQSARPPEVATTWTGVKFTIFRVERIAGDRLLVGVKIVATPGAPQNGTLLGTKPSVPAGASADDLASGKFDPKPFSLETSRMIDEGTQQEYPALKPDPAGKQYVPGEVLATLRPGNAEVLTVQFAAPPPPVDANGLPLKTKQTVSILLPNAQGPIVKVPVPPPLAP